MLLATEGIDLHFTDAAVQEIATIAEDVNVSGKAGREELPTSCNAITIVRSFVVGIVGQLSEDSNDKD